MNIETNNEVAQFVIVDKGIPNLEHISGTILTSMSNILSLSQAGHIPLVGLAIVNASYQPILRLTSTQKLQKILDAISSVKNNVKCRARISTDEFQDYIQLGIKMAIEDFESYLHENLVEGKVCPGKIQITIFSMKNLSALFNHLQTALQNFETRYLFKIQIVELAEDFSNLSPPKKDQRCLSSLEYLHVKGTVKILDKLMKQWLSCGDVLHHLKLVLPDLTIWCDARKCIGRPSSCQCLEDFEGRVEEDDVLQVIYVVPTDGICETQIFGDPVVLIPCQWQNHLQTEEYCRLINNTQCLLELSRKVATEDKYLIAKYEKTKLPTRFMVLMPGEGVLLAKELVSFEMNVLVTNNSLSLENDISPAIKSGVMSALQCLPSLSSYDPSDFSSGLYSHLLRKIRHPPAIELLNQELPKSEPVEKCVKIEVKRKLKLKKKRVRSKITARSISKLPVLTESDQQTLERCMSKHDLKVNPLS